MGFLACFRIYLQHGHWRNQNLVKIFFAEFRVLTAKIMKCYIFWNLTLLYCVENQVTFRSGVTLMSVIEEKQRNLVYNTLYTARTFRSEQLDEFWQIICRHVPKRKLNGFCCLLYEGGLVHYELERQHVCWSVMRYNCYGNGYQQIAKQRNIKHGRKLTLNNI
jgi:hypothetical protein